jgi:hypothetical protein
VSKPGKKKQHFVPTGSQTEPPRTSREIPRKESIISVSTLTSPKGKRYAVLETDQMDPYDRSRKKGKARG